MNRSFRGLSIAFFLFACAPALGQGTTTISNLPTANTPLAGTEVLPIVQGGVTKKVPASALGGSGGTAANPTATIGAAAVNGSATTYMRSDAAPALPATLPALNGSALTNLTPGNLSAAVPVAKGGTGQTSAGVGAITAIGGLTGTASSTTYVRGDGSWSTPAGGGAVSSVSGSGPVVCSPTTGSVVCGSTGLSKTVSTGYTIGSGDAGYLVASNSASAVAITVPSAASLGAGFAFETANYGAGTATYTSSNILGGTSGTTLVGTTGKGAFWTSDGTSWNLSANTTGSSSSGSLASGTAALGTSAISSGACTSAVTVTATGVLSTDVIMTSFNGDPTAVTGYTPGTAGMLTIIPYPTSGNVNFKVCNNTAGSITPGAITLNWKVGPR